MTLTILESPLRIGSLPTALVRRYAHALLQLFLGGSRPSSANDDEHDESFRFLSVTQSSSDLSIIADTHEMQRFQDAIRATDRELLQQLGFSNDQMQQRLHQCDSDRAPSDGDGEEGVVRLEVWPQQWKAIRLDEGALGFGMCQTRIDQHHHHMVVHHHCEHQTQR
jgi:hypothetical protein